MNVETPGPFGMDSARDRAAVFGGRSRTRPATVGRAILPPLWLEPRLHDQFQKICIQRPKFRQIQDRMDHPLRVARLLQIGEAKAPGKILRVDNVAYPERQRLSPDHDLIPYKQLEGTGLVLPPRVADRVSIVIIVGEMAEAGRH